jgi:hypothetical protein
LQTEMKDGKGQERTEINIIKIISSRSWAI